MHQGYISSPCQNCEYILDIHFQSDITHIWTKRQDGTTFHYSLAYHPKIYLAPDGMDTQYQQQPMRTIEQIAHEAAMHPDVVEVRLVSRFLSSKADTPVQVCEVQVVSPKRLAGVIADFRQKRYSMYNIDLNPRQQFFLDTSSFPMGACHIYTRIPGLVEYDVPPGCVELDRIEMHDNRNLIFYDLPPLRLMDVKVEIKQAQTFPQVSDPIEKIVLVMQIYERKYEREIVLQGKEPDILKALVAHIRSFDPDILNVPGGDRFVLNYLAHRAALHGLTPIFILGRLDLPLRPRKHAEGQSYMTYGQIMRRDPVWYIPGRIHIDADNSFFLYESGLSGLIDLSRMGGVPPERTSRASIGGALTGIEFYVNQSTIPPTLVPPNKADGEQIKPADILLIADNGGLIYPATPGVYDRVWAIDFTSLYPMIMAKHNIGNETVLCPHSNCREITVPELKYHICTKKVGVVPKTMFLVLQKRLLLKFLKKKKLPAPLKQKLKGMDSGLKWILVSCFGYLGFKNARWGSIESHQCVTAYARQYLMQARQICERHGYKVLAGITDSLFIRLDNPEADTSSKIQDLLRDITTEIGVPIDNEGRFQWLVFTPIRQFHDVAALNRYFGYFDHGEFKLRGIRHRQRRATRLEREFQETILEILSKAKSVDAFKELLPDTNTVLVAWKKRIMGHKIPATWMIIKIKSTRGAEGYRAGTTVQALAVKRYLKLGKSIKPGQSFRFLVRDNSDKTIDRVLIEEEIDENSPYDADWYCKLLEDSYLELTEAAQYQFYGRIRYRGDLGGVSTSLDEFFEIES